MDVLCGNRQITTLFMIVIIVVRIHNDYWYLCYYGQLVWDTLSFRSFGEKNMTHLYQGSMRDIFASAY